MELNESFIRMKKLAGLITEGKEQKMLDESILGTIKSTIKVIKQDRLLDKAQDMAEELTKLVDAIKQTPGYNEKYTIHFNGKHTPVVDVLSQEIKKYNDSLDNIGDALDSFRRYLTTT
jgi:coenzyme F420-reducing hydrogenase alpha subunit